MSSAASPLAERAHRALNDPFLQKALNTAIRRELGVTRE